MTSREQFSPIVQYEAIEYWEKRIYAFLFVVALPTVLYVNVEFLFHINNKIGRF